MNDHTLTPDDASGAADATPLEPYETYTPEWVCTATSPLAATLAAGHAGGPVSLWPTAQRTGAGRVMRNDARWLPEVPRRKRRSVDLLIATPPGRLTPIRPGTHPRSNQELVDRLASDLSATLYQCRQLLRPGGTVVVVTRLI